MTKDELGTVLRDRLSFMEVKKVNVCLIDVDSKIPNLALMKASTWHKQRGDTVKLGYDPLFDHPDLCYVSKIFDFSPEPEYLPDCEILRGGSGYSLTARMQQQVRIQEDSIQGLRALGEI